jgi:leucyl/phenylalanyl-tRNA---protein transferase
MSRDDVLIEITPQVLMKAYACGIFPMAESADDPALHWIEPQNRGVLPLDGVHIPKRLKRTIRTTPLKVRIDTDYEGIIDGCAGAREGRDSTWINGRIRSLSHGGGVGRATPRRGPLWCRAGRRLLRREHVFL